MRILANAGPYDLTHTWYVDGTATDVGTVTIGVTDANGDTVVAAGTATTNNADGTYDYQLANQTQVNLLYVTWTRSDTSAALTSTIEVVGGFLFGEAEARAFGAKANGTGFLASASEYTDTDIAEGRARVSDLLESWTERSWITRYCRAEFAGTGNRILLARDGDSRSSTGSPLHRPAKHNDINTIISVTVNGTAVTASNVKVDPTNGTLYRTDGVWSAATVSNPRNVVIEYSYGLPGSADGADRIGKLLLIDQLVPSAISDRAVSFTDELGTVRFETPGRNGNVSTIPEVNAWVKSHKTDIPLG